MGARIVDWIDLLDVRSHKDIYHHVWESQHLSPWQTRSSTLCPDSDAFGRELDSSRSRTAMSKPRSLSIKGEQVLCNKKIGVERYVYQPSSVKRNLDNKAAKEANDSITLGPSSRLEDQALRTTRAKHNSKGSEEGFMAVKSEKEQFLQFEQYPSPKLKWSREVKTVIPLDVLSREFGQHFVPEVPDYTYTSLWCPSSEQKAQLGPAWALTSFGETEEEQFRMLRSAGKRVGLQLQPENMDQFSSATYRRPQRSMLQEEYFSAGKEAISSDILPFSIPIELSPVLQDHLFGLNLTKTAEFILDKTEYVREVIGDFEMVGLQGGLLRSLGLLWPMLPAVVCFGAPAIPKTKGAGKLGKRSDDLPDILIILQGVWQALDAMRISKTFPAVYNGDEHRSKSSGSSSFYTAAGPLGEMTASNSARRNSFSLPALQITQLIQKKHMGRGSKERQTAEKAHSCGTSKEPALKTMTSGAHRRNIQALSTKQKTSKHPDTVESPKQNHRPARYFAPVLKKAPLCPLLIPNQSTVAASDIGPVANGMNPSFSFNGSHVPRRSKALPGLLRKKIGHKNPASALSSSKRKAAQERSVQFLSISKPLKLSCKATDDAANKQQQQQHAKKEQPRAEQSRLFAYVQMPKTVLRDPLDAYGMRFRLPLSYASERERSASLHLLLRYH